MVDQTADYEFLLTEYRKIWKNRLLTSEENNSEKILKEAMKRELLDENSHPRIRKNRYEKYYLSVKKVISAAILPEAKLQMIQIYTEQMEKLSEEG
ncbi:hypothetical protein ACF5W4_10530 [Bacillota bacterium Lsc_1132]